LSSSSLHAATPNASPHVSSTAAARRPMEKTHPIGIALSMKVKTTGFYALQAETGRIELGMVLRQGQAVTVNAT
jgi:hypothetical protein